MSHLKKNEDCQNAYGEEYQKMLDLNTQKRKKYFQDYQLENKDYVSA